MALSEEEKKAIYAVNFLNFAIFYYADGEMGDSEIDTVISKFQEWAVNERFGDLNDSFEYFSGESLNKVRTDFEKWSKDDIIRQIGIQADILYDYFGGNTQDLISFVNDLSAIANADGVVTEEEKFLVDKIAARWNIDPNLRSTNAEGCSRQNPGVVGYLYGTTGWKAGVIEWERGQTAYNRVYNANEFSAEGLSPGYEFLCLYVKAERTGGNDVPESIYDWSWNILGDRMSLHSGGAINPKPEFHGDVYPGGTVEGWIAKECFSGEGGLLAIFDPPSGSYDGSDKLYIRLS